MGLLLWLGTAVVLGLAVLKFRTLRVRRGWATADAAGFLDQAMFFIAGMLLIFPGPLSDLVGLALLIPAVRRKAAKKLLDRFRTPWFKGQGQGFNFSWKVGSRGSNNPGDPQAAGSPKDPPSAETPRKGRGRNNQPTISGEARDVEFETTERPQPPPRSS